MRILVLLGETPSSVAARRYAFHLARDMNAEVTGLAGVDLSFIEAPMAGGLGTTAYKVRLEEQLKKQAEDARRRLHEAFAAECEAQGLPPGWLSFDGDPMDALHIAAETRDLIVTGHDTAFHGDMREPLPENLGKLLSTMPRPVIVCGDEPPAGRDVLIAYDGSLPAMRAVHMFALLGIARDRRIHVTSVDPDQELAARRTSGAASLLRGYGYQVNPIPIPTSAHVSDVLKIQVADHGIGTLVMGAYGHGGWRKFLFGSTTGTLAEEPPCALFLYH